MTATIALAGEQLELDMHPLVIPDYEPDATIQERFEAFHAANDWVLTALEDLTERWLATGSKRLGIGMLWEVIRWQYGRATSGDEYRANNNFRSRYVRLMIDRHPDWADVFAVRELRAE